MGFVVFWWACIKRAFSVSLTATDKIDLWANIGSGAAALIGYQFAYQRSWPEIIFIAAVAAFFFRLLIVAPYQLWREKNAELGRGLAHAVALEVRLQPKIGIELPADAPREFPTMISNPDGQQFPGPPQKWVQFDVRSLTDVPLQGCEARLLSAYRISNEERRSILSEPLWCAWSNYPEREARRIVIASGITQSANIAALADTIYAQVLPSKFEFSDPLRQPGSYLFEIAVSAENVITEKRKIMMTWDGTYSGLTVKMVENVLS